MMFLLPNRKRSGRRQPKGTVNTAFCSGGQRQSAYFKTALCLALTARKRPVEQEVISDLQSPGEEEWHAHPSGAANKDGRQHRRDRSAYRPSYCGDACCCG